MPVFSKVRDYLDIKSSIPLDRILDFRLTADEHFRSKCCSRDDCTMDLIHGKCFITGSDQTRERGCETGEGEVRQGEASKAEREAMAREDPQGCDICHMLAFLDRHKHSWDASLDLSPMTDKIVKREGSGAQDRYISFRIGPIGVKVAGSVNDQQEVYELHVLGQLGCLLWEEYGKSKLRGSELAASCRK